MDNQKLRDIAQEGVVRGHAEGEFLQAIKKYQRAVGDHQRFAIVDMNECVDRGVSAEAMQLFEKIPTVHPGT